MIDNCKEILSFVDNYSKNLLSGLQAVNEDTLNKACNLILDTFKGDKNIFVCGNGGSSAIAEHLSCDHSKGIKSNTYFFPKVFSLVSNTSKITAYANDHDYSEIFSRQIVCVGRESDLLIAITSSGNSPNIINALECANKIGLKTIAFTGFDGGRAKDLCDVNIHIPVNNYGIVEDCHQIYMHIIAQYIRTIHTNVDLQNVKL